MNMPLLTVLDEIAYIIECAALDYLGEGKSAIRILCEKLESEDQEHEITNRGLISAQLRLALESYKSGDKLCGTSQLNAISRNLWKQCLCNAQHQTQMISISKPWHDGLGSRLLYIVGYFTFLPAFVVIGLRAVMEKSSNLFLHDLGILTLVTLGIALGIALATHYDHKKAHRQST